MYASLYASCPHYKCHALGWCRVGRERYSAHAKCPPCTHFITHRRAACLCMHGTLWKRYLENRDVWGGFQTLLCIWSCQKHSQLLSTFEWPRLIILIMCKCIYFWKVCLYRQRPVLGWVNRYGIDLSMKHKSLGFRFKVTYQPIFLPRIQFSRIIIWKIEELFSYSTNYANAPWIVWGLGGGVSTPPLTHSSRPSVPRCVVRTNGVFDHTRERVDCVDS